MKRITNACALSRDHTELFVEYVHAHAVYDAHLAQRSVFVNRCTRTKTVKIWIQRLIEAELVQRIKERGRICPKGSKLRSIAQPDITEWVHSREGWIVHRSKLKG